jgi:diguanylate cyclase (GGDEF)-like protein/PAS domain S-box-containing protein
MQASEETTQRPAADREAQRLALLAAYGVMDTPADPVLDTIVRIASRLLGVPIGLVSLVDDQRQWFKARTGLEVAQTARDIAFCDRVVRSESELVVEDALADPRFADNPLVTGSPHVRFYVGMPLRMPEDHVLGTLCAIDSEPRRLQPLELQQLRDLAAVAVARIVALRSETHLVHSQAELVTHHRFFESSLDLYCVASLDGYFIELNQRWFDALGWSGEELRSRPFIDFVHPDDVADTRYALQRLAAQGDLMRFRNRYRRADGSWAWLEWNAIAPAPWENRIFASARDVTGLVEAEAALRRQNGLLALISDSQSRFIAEGPSRDWWTQVLQGLLDLTDSEYGFIGETGIDEQGKFLRTKSITNIAWDDATRAFYEAKAPAGMYFRNMDTLFGHSILHEERVIANDVASDRRAGGRPHGHPPLNAFAGLPLRDGTQMIGMVGLANRPGGYHADILDPLEPVLAFLATILRTARLQEERTDFVRRLEAATELQQRVLQNSESGFVILHADGGVALANQRARDLLPEVAALLGRPAPGRLMDALDALFPRAQCAAWTDAIVAAREGERVGPWQFNVAPARGMPVRGGSGATATPVELVAVRVAEAESVESGVLLTINDLRERDALRESMRLNAVLEERVSQLRQQQHDNELLSECVEFLQGCTSIGEGLELVGRSLERLFPTANTAIFGSLSPGAPMTLLRHARRFGDCTPAEQLPPAQCWALRSHRAYGSWPGGHHLACRHVDPQVGGASFCTPLFSLDRNIAVFLVDFPAGAVTEDTLRYDARLAQFVAIGQSISGALSTIALRESLQRMALTDELTGLDNRRAFLQESSRELTRARRSGTPFSLAILDVDHFKQVNDRFGHDTGDQVLRDIARVVRRALRESDFVARIGGEEFAILMPEVHADVARSRLEGVLSAIRGACAVGGDPVTASIGMVHSTALAPDASYEQLYQRADEALYRAKAEGRNRIVEAAAPPSAAPREP